MVIEAFMAMEAKVVVVIEALMVMKMVVVGMEGLMVMEVVVVI